jgi:hypothetical protein
VRGPSIFFLRLREPHARQEGQRPPHPPRPCNCEEGRAVAFQPAPFARGWPSYPLPPSRGRVGVRGPGNALAPIRRRVPAPHVFCSGGEPLFLTQKGVPPPGPPSSKTVCAFVGRGCRPLVLGASPLAMSRPLWCGPAPAVSQGGEAASGLLPFPLAGSRGGGREDAPPAKKGRGQGPRCWWAGGTGGGRLPRRSLALAPRNDKARRWGLGAVCWWTGGPVGVGRWLPVGRRAAAPSPDQVQGR